MEIEMGRLTIGPIRVTFLCKFMFACFFALVRQSTYQGREIEHLIFAFLFVVINGSVIARPAGVSPKAEEKAVENVASATRRDKVSRPNTDEKTVASATGRAMVNRPTGGAANAAERDIVIRMFIKIYVILTVNTNCVFHVSWILNQPSHFN